MKLSNARARSPVADVQGRMSFAWKDACDGWTIEQRFEVRFTYQEGEEVSFDNSYVTWEAKDGESYRFNVRKLVNGQVEEELRGEASLSGGSGGTVTFNRPEQKEVELRPGAMFPTAHTLRLLEVAASGEPFFAATVFDGSEQEGATPVSAVIANARKSSAGGKGGDELRSDEAWPVHLAFFPSDPQAALPDYETSMLVQRNGVVQSMVIDYGDFQVDVTLDELQSVPAPRC